MGSQQCKEWAASNPMGDTGGAPRRTRPLRAFRPPQRSHATASTRSRSRPAFCWFWPAGRLAPRTIQCEPDFLAPQRRPTPRPTREVLPNIRVAILAQALVIETVAAGRKAARQERQDGSRCPPQLRLHHVATKHAARLCGSAHAGVATDCKVRQRVRYTLPRWRCRNLPSTCFVRTLQQCSWHLLL